MKPIKENVVIHIDLTNACHLSCANCTRLVGHHSKPFFMTLDEVRQAINSLEGFEGRIGMMGGEPLLHPEFKEICKIYQDMIPNRRKRELWTSGYNWEENKDMVAETFDDDLVHYNDHSKPDDGWHQPILISIDEVMEDKEKMWKLIDNCWLQRRWSAAITVDGAYFCEVAGSLDRALSGGQEGWKVEKGWWKKSPKDYRKQMEKTCLRCSVALPLAELPNNHVSHDTVSESNLKLLESYGSPKVKQKQIRLTTKEQATRYLESVPEVVLGERGYLESHPDWRPSEFRTKVWHSPGEGTLNGKEVRAVQKSSNNELPSKGADSQKIIADIRKRDYYVLTDKAFDCLEKEIDCEVVKKISVIKNKRFKEYSEIVTEIRKLAGNKLGERTEDTIVNFARESIFAGDDKILNG